MDDILLNAALEYKKLKDTVYKIVLGRKNKTYTIMLTFPYEAFFHLAGLQHLSDLVFPSYNKERIFKEILNGSITTQYIEKSVFFDEETYRVKDRITNLVKLKEIVESNSFIYLIQDNRYKAITGINADYVCEYNDTLEIIYLFLVHSYDTKMPDRCKGCSFFKKNKLDYTKNTSKTTTLLIQKIEDHLELELYKKATYNDSLST